MAIPNDQRSAMVDRQFGVAPALNRWLALTSTMPTDAAAGTELAGNGYARQPITFTPAVDGATANDALITFTAAGGAWLEAVGCEVYDAATGGTRLYWDDLAAPRTANDGDVLEIEAGALTYSFNAS